MGKTVRDNIIKLSIFLLVTLGMYGSVYAQEPKDSIPPPSKLTTPPTTSKLPELQKKEPESKRPDHVLPPLPPAGKKAPLSSAIKVFVRKFAFEGNTVFTTETLSQVIAPYENRKIRFEELQEVRRQLTLFYINKGYINSGVIIPDQKVEQGIITLQIIEGRVSQLEIYGNTWLSTGYIRNRLEIGTGGGERPFNVNELRQTLKLMQHNPLVKRINAELSAGHQRGQGVLKVKVKEARPYRLNVKLSNHSSPSVGSYRGDIGVSHLNLTGWGDSLGLHYGRTEGLESYAADYKIPVNRWDTTLGLHGNRSQSVVITEPFNELDIESESETSGFSLRHPFYRTPSREFAMGLKLEKRYSKTFMLNRPFSFSSGVNEGVSRVSVLRFSQEWVDQAQHQVIAIRSNFSFGLDEWDATVNEKTPDSLFTTWLGQFQWVRRVELLDSQILYRVDNQRSNDRLLPMEKFAIGGASTVRGYRENQLTHDNGIVTSLEWRVPTVRLAIPMLSTGPGDGILQIATFIDYGRGWNEREPTPEIENISSVGLGFRWSPGSMLQTELYWGQAQRKFDEPEQKDLQDDGIHFQINVQVF